VIHFAILKFHTLNNDIQWKFFR
jgi:secreted Zn-dependent insulinase-like peptidase